jgi:hypothetical protein
MRCWTLSSCLPPLGLRLSHGDPVTVYAFADAYAMPRLLKVVIDLVFATIFDD